MNILLIHQYFLEKDGPGGARFNEMTKIWSDNGHQVSVLAGMMPEHTGKKRREYYKKLFAHKIHGAVDVYRCHVSESYNKSPVGRAWGYFTFICLALWSGLFRIKGRFDLVLVTSPPIFIGIIGYVLAKLKRIPLVFEIRDLWPDGLIDTGALKNKLIINSLLWLERFLYNKSKLVTVLTPAFRQVLIERKNVNPGKILYIPNAADFTIPEKLHKDFNRIGFRKELGIHDKFVVIYVGAHGLANGLHQILDTAELLADTNVLFLLIGKGMQRDKLIKDAKERSIKNVTFLDPVPKSEIYKYTIAADMGASVLAKNDFYKTIYSNKTFDYMSCKKPILMAINGISRKLVEDADAGVYVESENPSDFAEKIRWYLENPKKLSEQGDNGYNYAKKHFDRDNLAKSYQDSLCKLLLQ